MEETVKATLTGTITAPTEEAEGEGEYTAVFANDVFTAQTITHAIPRLSAYELYLENSALEQDAAGNYKVEPGQTVQLTLYAKSNQNTKLQALLVNIGNDAALTNVGFTPAEGTVITAGATSGTNTKLLKVQDDTPITLSAGTPVALGVMSVKVPEGVSGNQFKLTFDGGTQQFSVEGSIDEINPTCTGATLVIAKDCTVSFDTDGDGTDDPNEPEEPKISAREQFINEHYLLLGTLEESPNSIGLFCSYYIDDLVITVVPDEEAPDRTRNRLFPDSPADESILPPVEWIPTPEPTQAPEDDSEGNNDSTDNND